MKKLKRLLLLFSLMIGAVILTACGEAVAEQDIAQRIEASETPVITWGTKADTNLLGIYDVEQGEIVGFDVDIAEALTDEITDGQGVAEIVEVTSKTRIPLLKNGNIDAIAATMTATEERAQVVDFSDVYFDAGQSLLVPEDSDIQGIDDLTSEHTVIGIKGSTSVQNFRELNPDPEVIELENYSEGFVALQSGQGDALTTDSAILLGMIDQNPNYRLAGANFTEEPYAIAINQGQDDFLNQVDEALDTIQANGVYDEIYDKWFGDIYPAQEPGSPSTSTTEYANPDGVESEESEGDSQ
jgi:putative glutamine transport system substrate-binding protein